MADLITAERSGVGVNMDQVTHYEFRRRVVDIDDDNEAEVSDVLVMRKTDGSSIVYRGSQAREIWTKILMRPDKV